MRIIQAITDGFVLIGKQGENNATQIQFPVVETWKSMFGENGVFQLLILRPTENTPYAVPVTADANVVMWNVSGTDLEIPGIGGCELRYIVDNTLAKSQSYVTLTKDAIGGSDAPYPTPWEEWVDQVLQAGADAVGYAADAESSAEAALASETAAEAAKEAAQAAATGAAESRDAAETAASNAATSEANAAESEGNAADSAAEALLSKNAAVQAKTDAQTFASNAGVSASAAAVSATNAAASASSASVSATAAGNSASAAASDQATASAARDEAVAAASSAATSETNAETAQAAAEAAQEAAETAESSAASSASAASSSATAAGNSATAAGAAQTAAEAAQAAAEAAQAVTETAAATVSGAVTEITTLRTDVNKLEDDTYVPQAHGPGGILSFECARPHRITGVTADVIPWQTGTGDPSPDNIRPLNGYTGITVYKTGLNLFNKTSYTNNRYLQSDGTYHTLSGSMVTGYIPVKGGETYFHTRLLPNGYPRYSAWYTAEKTLISTFLPTYSGGSDTAPENAAYVRYSASKDYLDTLMVGVGSSTSVPYEAYRASTWTINFPEEAGTVYGGGLTVDKNGDSILSVRPYYASYDGETLVGPWISDRDVYVEGTVPTTGAEVVDLGGTSATYSITGTGDWYTDAGSQNIWHTNGGSISMVCMVPAADAITEAVADCDGRITAINGGTLIPVYAMDYSNTGYIGQTSGKTSSSSYYRYISLNRGYGYRDAYEMTDSTYEIALRFYSSNGDISTGTGYLGGTGYVSQAKVYVPENAVLAAVCVRRTDRQTIDASDSDAIRAGMKVYTWAANKLQRDIELQNGTYVYLPQVAKADSYINGSGEEATSTIQSRYKPMPVLYGHIYRITIAVTTQFTMYIHGLADDVGQMYESDKWIRRLYGFDTPQNTTFHVDIVINDRRIRNIAFACRTNISSVTVADVGIFDDDGLGLHSLPPVNNIKNAVKRARHFTDIKWTPTVDLPRVARIGNDRYTTGLGVKYDNIFKAGVTYTGLPYSQGNRSAMATYGYSYAHMTYDEPLDAFMTSLDNPHSFLNAQSRQGSGDSLEATAYGTVCDNLVCYALGIEWKGSHAGFTDLVDSGRLKLTTTVADIDDNLNKVDIGDALIYINHHVTIITDLIRDTDGTITAIEVSESTTAGMIRPDTDGGPYGGVCRRCTFTIAELKAKFADYTIYHSGDIWKTPYTQSPWVTVGNESPLAYMPAAGNMPCLPYMGENFVYKVGYIPNSKVLVSDESYGYLAVYKDGELFEIFTYTPDSGEVTVGFSAAGSYEAFLFNSSDGTITNMTSSSLGCHWTVIS